MDRLLTASDVEGKLDCYGEFNREDDICVALCALNTQCAILTAKGIQQLRAWEDPPVFFPQTSRLP